MKEILALVGSFIMLFCTVPYIIDIIKGKTRPNIVSWFTWSLLIGIGAAALFASHQQHSAWLLTADFITTFSVVLVGLKYGIAKIDLFDIACQIGAIVGLILWLVLNSPLIAIYATISIDFIGTMPTVKHSWMKPNEETAITYALGIAATLLVLLSQKQYTISGWIYPAYLMFSNVMLLTVIMYSRRRIAVAS